MKTIILFILSIASSSSLTFNSTFGSYMILQSEPKQACVYGTYDESTNLTLSLRTSENVDILKIVPQTYNSNLWKACMKPIPASISTKYNITISDDNSNASSTIHSILFGDVWYCAGQSNMALPLLHTLSRNQTVSSILVSDAYSNIRIHGIAGNMNPDQPWITPKDAASSCTETPETCPLFKYSSTCWYFAQSLSELVTDRPIGMIHTSFGGSTIEQWLDNATISTCRNATIDSSNAQWHEERVLPYLSTSLKGWIWYQGENDMHGVFGNSALGYGYGCLMSTLVKSWRSIWSQAKEDDPFGIVTLASSGSEGGRDIGTYIFFKGSAKRSESSLILSLSLSLSLLPLSLIIIIIIIQLFLHFQVQCDGHKPQTTESCQTMRCLIRF